MVTKKRKEKPPVVITQDDIKNARTIMAMAKEYPFEKRDIELNPDITSGQLFLLRYNWASMKCLNRIYVAVSPGIRSYIASEGARSPRRKERQVYRQKKKKPSEKRPLTDPVICPEDYWRRVVQELSCVNRGLYIPDGPGVMSYIEQEQEQALV